MATARRSGDGGSGEGRDRQRDGGRRRSRDSGDGAGSAPDLRQRPVDLAAERGVLGSFFLKPDACDDVALVLRPEDFADEAHQMKNPSTQQYKAMMQVGRALSSAVQGWTGGKCSRQGLRS